jgi:hypothetical protein
MTKHVLPGTSRLLLRWWRDWSLVTCTRTLAATGALSGSSLVYLSKEG